MEFDDTIEIEPHRSMTGSSTFMGRIDEFTLWYEPRAYLTDRYRAQKRQKSYRAGLINGYLRSIRATGYQTNMKQSPEALGFFERYFNDLSPWPCGRVSRWRRLPGVRENAYSRFRYAQVSFRSRS